jgi:hypothetical protein
VTKRICKPIAPLVATSPKKPSNPIRIKTAGAIAPLQLAGPKFRKVVQRSAVNIAGRKSYPEKSYAAVDVVAEMAKAQARLAKKRVAEAKKRAKAEEEKTEKSKERFSHIDPLAEKKRVSNSTIDFDSSTHFVSCNRLWSG